MDSSHADGRGPDDDDVDISAFWLGTPDDVHGLDKILLVLVDRHMLLLAWQRSVVGTPKNCHKTRKSWQICQNVR
eukprot:CAMPEP_0177688148 /NCGR_PEP_ID=MMETSP0447-20121125/34508_1 /TAXON_ID=0 /ORGANISM="Stygamoeba regulata, Strain BSH-02190019" /LENGTH=74 /DNA_ID=CAMNT_0019198439 /DNA_START=714 /DNA_END=938 /DNA_ORIENTATION=+